MSEAVFPEADRLDGAPHPRETTRFIGHTEAEGALLSAYRTGRMHHAWILGGGEGIGKATLAYRLARFVLTHPDPGAPAAAAAENLAVAPETPAARRVAQLSHPDLLVLRRAYNPERKTLMTEIRVDDVRRAASFFGSTAGAGGWRVCIVDTADDLNASGANALLKVLEEPPPCSLFLILSAAPSRLLPTIRSRCRLLPMRPLTAEEVAAVLSELPLVADLAPEDMRRIAETADGSIRRAAELVAEDALELRDRLSAILDRLPALDAAQLNALVEQVAGRDGARSFDLLAGQLLDWLHTRARRGAEQSEPRLARWAELWDKTARAVREAEIYNLDRRPLVLAIVSDVAAAARD